MGLTLPSLTLQIRAFSEAICIVFMKWIALNFNGQWLLAKDDAFFNF